MYLLVNSLRIEILPVTPISQNCMMIWDPDSADAIISDPGGDLESIVRLIESKNVCVQSILLTHGHFDHVGVALPLQTFLEHKYQKKIPILGPAIEDQFLLDRVVEDASQFGVYIQHASNVTPTRFVEDGDILQFGEMVFEVMHMPGHTPGHVIFYEKNARFVITGDVLFKAAIGRTDFPYGNEKQLITAINQKLLILDDATFVLPGHGPVTTIGYEKGHNPFLI